MATEYSDVAAAAEAFVDLHQRRRSKEDLRECLLLLRSEVSRLLPAQSHPPEPERSVSGLGDLDDASVAALLRERMEGGKAVYVMQAERDFLGLRVLNESHTLAVALFGDAGRTLNKWFARMSPLCDPMVLTAWLATLATFAGLLREGWWPLSLLSLPALLGITLALVVQPLEMLLGHWEVYFILAEIAMLFLGLADVLAWDYRTVPLLLAFYASVNVAFRDAWHPRLRTSVTKFVFLSGVGFFCVAAALSCGSVPSMARHIVDVRRFGVHWRFDNVSFVVERCLTVGLFQLRHAGSAFLFPDNCVVLKACVRLKRLTAAELRVLVQDAGRLRVSTSLADAADSRCAEATCLTHEV